LRVVSLNYNGNVVSLNYNGKGIVSCNRIGRFADMGICKFE